MTMTFSDTDLPGVIVVKPERYGDLRGFFNETYHLKKYEKAGLARFFVQDNHSRSKRGTLRGLHYQLRKAQEKLVYVVTGEIFDVAVDIRKGSPFFGRWTGAVLSSENGHQVFIPAGFAHGFCVLSETADVIYKCTEFYDPDDAFGILWSDPAVGIDWPLKDPVLSEKDMCCPTLDRVPNSLLPQYKD